MATRLLITGATGLIGQHLVGQAARAGLEVVTVDRETHDLLRPGVPDALVRETAPDLVVHLAWCASGTPGYRESPDNEQWVTASLDLAAACAATGARITGVGTVLDDRPGDDAYSRAKAALRHRLAPAIDAGRMLWLRPFYVFDPVAGRPALVAEALAAARESRPATLASPDAAHDFVLAEDVAGGALAAVTGGLTGVVDVGSGRLHSVARLAERLGATWASPGDTPPRAQHDERTADLGPLRALGWAPTATEVFFDHG